MAGKGEKERKGVRGTERETDESGKEREREKRGKCGKEVQTGGIVSAVIADRRVAR